MSEIHLFKSQIPEAISDFQQELAINPSHAATHYKLADAYSRVQKFDDAERLLQRSIWLDPTSTGPYVLMGKVLEKKGEPELEIRALKRGSDESEQFDDTPVAWPGVSRSGLQRRTRIENCKPAAGAENELQ